MCEGSISAARVRPADTTHPRHQRRLPARARATARPRRDVRRAARSTSAGTPRRSINVSSMPVRALPPMARPIAVIGRLARPIAIACQTAPGGSRSTSSTRAFGVAGIPPRTPITIEKDSGSSTRPSSTSCTTDVEMARVVDLELWLDGKLPHPRREPAHALGRVAELAGAEAHRARVQRCHPRPRLDEALALLERHLETDAGRQLNQRRARFLDQRRRRASRSRRRRSAGPPRPGGGGGRSPRPPRTHRAPPPLSPQARSAGSGCRPWSRSGLSAPQ